MASAAQSECLKRVGNEGFDVFQVIFRYKKCYLFMLKKRKQLTFFTMQMEFLLCVGFATEFQCGVFPV